MSTIFLCAFSFLGCFPSCLLTFFLYNISNLILWLKLTDSCSSFYLACLGNSWKSWSLLTYSTQVSKEEIKFFLSHDVIFNCIESDLNLPALTFLHINISFAYNECIESKLSIYIIEWVELPALTVWHQLFPWHHLLPPPTPRPQPPPYLTRGAHQLLSSWQHGPKTSLPRWDHLWDLTVCVILMLNFVQWKASQFSCPIVCVKI